jgi:hypothetical protein
MSKLILKQFDLVSQQWLPTHCQSTYHNTMLGHLFPDIKFAVGDVGSLLAHENPNTDYIAEVLDKGFEEYVLVGGSGSRKEGKAIYSTSEFDCFTRFFGSNMNAGNYGSNLTTECKLIKDVSIKLLVVNDGDTKSKKYRTGDCHGKCSEKFAKDITGSIPKFKIVDGKKVQDGFEEPTTVNPFQFRAFNMHPDWCAKGTIAVGFKKGKYDLVLPASSFKGMKVAPGEYDLPKLAFGVVFKSPSKKARLIETEETDTEIIERYAMGWDFRKSNLSYSVVQFLPWDCVQKDIVPVAQRQAQELNILVNNPQKLLDYLLRKGDENEDVSESRLSRILKSDIHGQLSTHPWAIKSTMGMLSRRWREIATSGGMKFNSSMVMPDEELPDDCCYIPGLADGEEVIVFPYPCRWKHDIKVWTNKVLPKWENQEGVIVGNCNTLMKLSRDTDGDFLMWLPASKLPHVAQVVKAFGEPDLDQAGLKPKKIPIAGTLGEILVKSMENLTGLITYYIAKSWACKREDFVFQLVPQLQAAVDSLKGATPPDRKLLDAIGNALKAQRVDWLKQVKDDDCYMYYQMSSRPNDTVGLMIAEVNKLWVKPDLKATNLRPFNVLFSHLNPSKKWIERAEVVSTQYSSAMYAAGLEQRRWEESNPGKRVPRIIKERRLSSQKDVVKYYEGILDHLPPAQKMKAVAAFWDVKHRNNKTGIPNPQAKEHEEKVGFSTNICFLLGIEQICEQLQELRIDTLNIVGRTYSDFRNHIFKGEMIVMKIESGTGNDGKHYFIAKSNNHSIGVVPIRDTPPIKYGEEITVHLHTRFDKVGYPSYNEAYVVK